MIAASALLGASCAGPWNEQRYEAETGPWGLSLSWTHYWKPEDAGNKTCQGRFETLEVTLPYGRSGEDLSFDSEGVGASYNHGAMASCARTHKVTGRVRVLDLVPTSVRAHVDAVMHCPDGEPVSLKGEFAFDTKVPR